MMARSILNLALLGVLLVSSVESFASRDDPLHRLTHDGLDKQRPSWSPDGKRLTFARHESGGAHIWQYVMDADNPSSLRRLTDRKAPEYNGVFSPDGKRLLLAIITLSGTQG